MKKKYILIAALLVGSANLFANTVVIDNGIAIENVLENISVKVKVTNNDMAIAGVTVTILAGGETLGTGVTDSKGYSNISIAEFKGGAVDIKAESANYQTIILKGALIKDNAYYPIKTQKMLEGLQAVKTIIVDNSIAAIEAKSENKIDKINSNTEGHIQKAEDSADAVAESVKGKEEATIEAEKHKEAKEKSSIEAGNLQSDADLLAVENAQKAQDVTSNTEAAITQRENDKAAQQEKLIAYEKQVAKDKAAEEAIEMKKKADKESGKAEKEAREKAKELEKEANELEMKAKAEAKEAKSLEKEAKEEVKIAEKLAKEEKKAAIAKAKEVKAAEQAKKDQEKYQSKMDSYTVQLKKLETSKAKIDKKQNKLNSKIDASKIEPEDAKLAQAKLDELYAKHEQKVVKINNSIKKLTKKYKK